MDVQGEHSRICEDCIGESLLKREISEQGEVGGCTYCQSEDSRAVPLRWLADRVKPTYEVLVARAPEEIRFSGGRTYTQPNGEAPSDVLSELIQPDDRGIAVDLIAIMGRGEAWRFRDGGIDIYDDAAEEFTIEEPDGSALRRRWIDFCTSLQHERRFFNAEGAAVLDEVFGPILRGEHPGDAVRTIGPGDPDRFIYRARQANDDGGRRTIFERVINQLSAPAPGVSGAGRMNAAGISVFYGSFDVETCVAELRVPVGGAAIVGRFEVVRPLRILDLTRLAASAQRLSYFDPDYVDARTYAEFIEGFHQEIRRAVIPGRETLDYLPTQIVAEYLWSQTDPPVDGVIFGSAQISESANNIVLFPHASSVAEAEDEAHRPLQRLYRYASYDEDEETTGQPEQHVLFAPAPPPEPRTPAFDPFDVEGEWFSGVGSLDIPTAQPALRLLVDEISIVEVTGIHFDTATLPVRFSAQDDNDI